MRLEQIKACCQSKWKACEDYPFGDIPICYRLNQKIFAQIYPNPQDYKTLFSELCIHKNELINIHRKQQAYIF